MLAEWLGGYGIAIIALSFLSFVLLYPFTRKAYQKQQEELHLQKILQEQIKNIKANYSGAEQFDKIQRLYDRYSYHPIMAVRSVFGLLIQLPFLLAVFYMLSNCTEIQGISWGVIPNLGKPDALLHGINLLPFAMAFVSVIYAFIVPNFDKKQIVQTVIISILFLLLLYSAPSALLIFWTCNLFWSLLDSVFGKKTEWLREFISDNELAFHIIFALALTVGLLVPLDAYIKNASQLWFSIKDILKYFLTDTAICFVFLMFIYVVFWIKKIRCFYLSILLGVLLGAFLQSYVIGVDYGLFDGHEIAWEQYTKVGLLNSFIWLFCLGETFVVFKRLKFDFEKLKKYVKPVTFGIIVIQCIALLFSLKNNPLPCNSFRSKDLISVLTTKDMFSISSKENIIIFLLDAFDANIFEEIMVKDPEIIEKLRGFTFYPDTTSLYGYTDYSLPQILTGKIYYNDRPYVEYFENAWNNNPYYQYLLNNNFDIGIYTNGTHVLRTAPISNLANEKIELNESSMQDFNNLVLFRMVPHFIKKGFYDYDPNAWIRLIANKKAQVYKEDDRQFYLNLKKGLLYRDDKNCFRFYHLAGAHYPFILNRNLELVSKNENGSRYEQCIGVLKIVLEFIEQMKRKNIFDNSTFVIMADHGYHNEVGSRPLLCIKYSKNDSLAMKISDKPVSYSYFLPMIFEKEVKFPLDRRFYVMDRKNLIEYKISGKAGDINSWEKVGVLEGIYNKRNNLYKLGEEIVFNLQNQSAERFQLGGWDRMEPYGVWSLGSDAKLQFKINEYRGKDLQFQFLANAYLSDLAQRNVKVYVNKTLVAKLAFDNSKTWFSFIIPSSVITADDIINIHFSIDHGGVSMVREGKRDLGIFLQWIKIEEIN